MESLLAQSLTLFADFPNRVFEEVADVLLEVFEPALDCRCPQVVVTNHNRAVTVVCTFLEVLLWWSLTHQLSVRLVYKVFYRGALEGHLWDSVFVATR